MILTKYNTQEDFYFPMVKRGAVDFAVSGDWTPATGDVKISKDGGTAADTTNLPTAVTMGNTAMWKLTLTATELSAKKILITVADAATKAVEDQMLIIHTYGNASAQHPFDLGTALSSQTVGTVTNVSDKTGYTAATVSDKTGYSLSSAGITAVWDEPIAQPTSVPAWAGMTARKGMQWVVALLKNKATQTSSQTLVRNEADNATIGTSSISDDGSTFTKGGFV